MIRVKQIGSPIRRHHSQRATLIGLGLNKIGRVVSVPDTPQSWGMIRKVRHLICLPDVHRFEEHRLVRPRRKDEDADIALMRKLAFDRRRITLERIDHKRMPGKSPDFRLFKDKKLRGYCELKSPRDDWVFDVPRDLKAGEIRQAVRRGPVAERLAVHIGTAAAQLDAVNPDHALPNILVFVSHARRRGPADVQMTIEGIRGPDGRHLFLHDEEKSEEEAREAQEKLWDAARRIDLIVWIDVHTGKCHLIFPLGAEQLAEARDLFGVKPPEPRG